MLVHPYRDFQAGQWVRGNLHAHTTNSDGHRDTQSVIDDYASRGYGYLMISDHDYLTTQKQYDQFQSRGMLLIPGNEITANGPHLLHVNANALIAPDAQRQRAILQANASGGFIIVNHPNWQQAFDHCSINQLAEWVDYAGMEIYNGVISKLDGSPYATNKWDMLLAKGRRVWGFANDDSHFAVGDVGLGWNVTQLRDHSVQGVVDALAQGRFYASTGVVIRDIQVHDMTIRIETENAQRIVALHQVGCRFAQADSNVIEVQVPAKAKYVRFECWGSGENFAWTQPFWVEA